MLKIGNDYEDTRRDTFAAHVKLAVDASKTNHVRDPSADG